MRYVDGLRVATNAFEAAAWRYTVKIACPCGHAITLDPHGLWWACERRGRSDRFIDIARRCYCARCYLAFNRKVRPTVSACSHEPPTLRLPMPNEREWKRALSRFRA